MSVNGHQFPSVPCTVDDTFNYKNSLYYIRAWTQWDLRQGAQYNFLKQFYLNEMFWIFKGSQKKDNKCIVYKVNF